MSLLWTHSQKNITREVDLISAKRTEDRQLKTPGIVSESLSKSHGEIFDEESFKWKHIYSTKECYTLSVIEWKNNNKYVEMLKSTLSSDNLRQWCFRRHNKFQEMDKKIKLYDVYFVQN